MQARSRKEMIVVLTWIRREEKFNLAGTSVAPPRTFQLEEQENGLITSSLEFAAPAEAFLAPAPRDGA